MTTRRHIAVAAPAREAAEAAREVAAQGGNAIDAAVAAILTACVTEVGIVSPMGGAFVNVWAPGEEPVVLDGNVEMPGRGRPREWFGTGVRDFFMDYYGGFTVYGGHGAVATPGMFAALDAASTRWGSLPWAELMRPAAHVARSGWRIGPSTAFYLEHSGGNLFAWDPQTADFMTQGRGGGELEAEVADRAAPVVERMVEKLPAGGTLVVVSHGGTIRTTIGRLLGLAPATWEALGGLSNCCWSVLGEGMRGWRLLEHNAGSLPEPVLGDDD